MKWHTPFALQADLTYALHELPDKQKAEPHKWPPLPPRIESGVRALLRRLGPMVAAEYAGYGIPAPVFLPEV